MHKKDSSSIEKHQFKPIGRFHKEKLRGQNASTERYNNTVLAYERFFLRLLSEELVLLVICACIKLQQNSSLAVSIDS